MIQVNKEWVFLEKRNRARPMRVASERPTVWTRLTGKTLAGFRISIENRCDLIESSRSRSATTINSSEIKRETKLGPFSLSLDDAFVYLINRSSFSPREASLFMFLPKKNGSMFKFLSTFIDIDRVPIILTGFRFFCGEIDGAGASVAKKANSKKNGGRFSAILFRSFPIGWRRIAAFFFLFFSYCVGMLSWWNFFLFFFFFALPADYANASVLRTSRRHFLWRCSRPLSRRFY